MRAGERPADWLARALGDVGPGGSGTRASTGTPSASVSPAATARPSGSRRSRGRTPRPGRGSSPCSPPGPRHDPSKWITQSAFALIA